MPEPYYEVRDPNVESLLRDIGYLLKAACDEHGYLFSLHIFNKGEGGGVFYVSSANRDDYIKMLKEFIQKFEAN